MTPTQHRVVSLLDEEKIFSCPRDTSLALCSYCCGNENPQSSTDPRVELKQPRSMLTPHHLGAHPRQRPPPPRQPRCRTVAGAATFPQCFYKKPLPARRGRACR